MAALTPVDAVLSVGQRIGRYFTLVSLIPALLLVLWTYLLIASGALGGSPKLSSAEAAISHWTVSKAISIVLASLAIAFVLHPLQFATTQVLEGYWGTTALATAAMKLRIIHHRKRRRALVDKAGASYKALRKACLEMFPGSSAWDEESQDSLIATTMLSDGGDLLIFHYIAEQEARDRQETMYPSDPRRILPTELGNVLRRFEDAAGKQYGLDVLTIAPHLHLVAPARHLEYLGDAREDMDTAIRICTVGLVAALLTVGFLLTHGLWLLWALLPYSVSYLAYKGAVSAAQGYGSVVASVVDLDRFILYDELGLCRPRDSQEERDNNSKLMDLMSGDSANLVNIYYRRDNTTSAGNPRPTFRLRKPRSTG